MKTGHSMRDTEGAGASDTIAEGDLQGRQLLVIEDARDIQRLLSHWLSKAGAEVTLADNGLAGIGRVRKKMAEKQAFDAILTDLQMPIVDGWQAIREIRALGFDRPIIVISAEVDAVRQQQAQDAGSNDFLTKPFTREQLISVILRHTCSTS